MLISVIIPCFNGEDCIADAVQSVLAQSHATLQCIIIDDRSTDRSASIIADLAARDRRVTPIYLSKNRGAAGARNAGLSVAQGEWITFLDADDLYYEHRLSKLLSVARSTDAEIAYDNLAIADYPSMTPKYVAFANLPKRVSLLSSEDYLRRSIGLNGSLSSGYIKPIISSALLRRTDIEFDVRFRSGEDFLFYSQLIIEARSVAATSEATYLYRRRAGSLTQTGISHVGQQAQISEILLAKYPSALTKGSIRHLRTRQKALRDLARIAALTASIRTGTLSATVSFRDLRLPLTMARLLVHNHRMGAGRMRIAGK